MSTDRRTHVRLASRTSRIALAALTFAVGLTFGAGRASAEEMLVSNLGEEAGGVWSFSGSTPKYAQAFTPGSVEDYLSSVVLVLPAGPLGVDNVEVFKADGDGLLDSSPQLIATLMDYVLDEGNDRYRFSQYGEMAVDDHFVSGQTYWVVVTSNGSPTCYWEYTYSQSWTGSGELPFDSSIGLYGGSSWLYQNLDWGPQKMEVRHSTATAVELTDLAATWTGTAARVTWRTGSEKDNAYFRLWRADAGSKEFSQVPGAVIAAEGNAGAGASYSFDDTGVLAGETYRYQLEDVDTNGGSTMHGPITVAMARIRLLGPASGATIRSGRRARFSWDGGPCERFQVQFSRHARFATRSLTLPGGQGSEWTTGTSFRPTAAEWRAMVRLAGRTGRLAWRVVGETADGARVTSRVKALRIR